MSATLDTFRSPRVQIERFVPQATPRADSAPRLYLVSVRERSERRPIPREWFTAPLTCLDIPPFPGS